MTRRFVDTVIEDQAAGPVEDKPRPAPAEPMADGPAAPADEAGTDQPAPRRAKRIQTEE